MTSHMREPTKSIRNIEPVVFFITNTPEDVTVKYPTKVIGNISVHMILCWCNKLQLSIGLNTSVGCGEGGGGDIH